MAEEEKSDGPCEASAPERFSHLFPEVTSIEWHIPQDGSASGGIRLTEAKVDQTDQRNVNSFFPMGYYIRWFLLWEKQLKPLEKGLTLEHVDAGDGTARILVLGQQNVFLGPFRENGMGENDLEKRQFMGFKQIQCLNIFQSSSLPRSNWSPLCWGKLWDFIWFHDLWESWIPLILTLCKV